MVITFAGALRQDLLNAFELFSCAEGCCGIINTVEPLFTVATQSRVVSTSEANFSSLIDGCLKYKIKEKPKNRPEAWPASEL